MSSSLPESIYYPELPNSLSSNITSTTQILNPVNSKSTYTSSDIINFDLEIMGSLIQKVYILVIRHHARLELEPQVA